ncbi:MAG: hypothetical protein WDO19_19440 [Bacteroidota bacterium]
MSHPGPISIPTAHVTILEAIGLAGDIPLTGKKNTVRILRETNGKREIGYIDLTSKKIFDSPYYNLLQNDVVMVEVTKSKIRQSDQATLQTHYYRIRNCYKPDFALYYIHKIAAFFHLIFTINTRHGRSIDQQ